MTDQVWLCGSIPKDLSGRYYCPYCKFNSNSIEDFAVGMCWYCVYGEITNKEEQMAFDLNTIKVGDKVTLETTFTVSRIDQYEGAIFGKDLNGRKFPVTNNTSYYRNSDRHVFNIKDVRKPAAPVIEHMPVQAGDVWADNTGEEYHALRSAGSVKIFTLADQIVSESTLKAKPGLKLIHRKGNRR